MRKFLFAIMLLSAINIAFVQAGDIRILHPENTSTSSNKGKKPRSPIAPIYYDQDEKTLTFDESCVGCPITLLDENGDIVLTSLVDENGIVELPSDLIGTFVLQLTRANITFEGEIEL